MHHLTSSRVPNQTANSTLIWAPSASAATSTCIRTRIPSLARYRVGLVSTLPSIDTTTSLDPGTFTTTKRVPAPREESDNGSSPKNALPSKPYLASDPIRQPNAPRDVLILARNHTNRILDVAWIGGVRILEVAGWGELGYWRSLGWGFRILGRSKVSLPSLLFLSFSPVLFMLITIFSVVPQLPVR